VDPEAHHSEHVGVVGRHGAEEALEDVADIAEVEDVVELDGRGEEGTRDLRLQVHRRLRDLFALLLDVGGESGQVPREDRVEDDKKRLNRGHLHRVGAVGALQARVDVEGAGRGVEARHGLDVLNIAPGELVARVPPIIIKELPEEGNGLLGPVLVDLGHVDVVDEVDHLLGPGGAEGAASLLLENALHGALEEHRVGEAVEVDVHVGKGVGVHVAQLVGHDCRLARASAADKHAGVLVGHEELEEVGQALRLHGGDVDVAKDHGGRVRVLGHLLQPGDEGGAEDLVLELEGEHVLADAVVEDRPLLGKADRLELVAPEAVKCLAVVDLLVGKGAAPDRPHAGVVEV